MTTASGAGGPYFEELELGMVAATVPSMTLTAGHSALHQAVVGDRLRLSLDATLSARVLGEGPMLAHPGLVCDVAIGQSTLLTQRVVANLFYRGLRFHRAPRIGDTLSTSVEVVGLRQNSPRAGRVATGMAVLRIRTSDQRGRLVLDFWRCAMLPLRDPNLRTAHADALDTFAAAAEPSLGAAIEGWDLGEYRAAVPGPHLADVAAGDRWCVGSGDVVSAAPELVRLTLNLAAAHHDAQSTGRGRRLVYGGHTIGLVLSQVTRCLPSLVTVVGWHHCDHTGPVFEGDTIRTELELERISALPAGGGLVHLRALARATGEGDREPRQVLDWRVIGVLA